MKGFFVAVAGLAVWLAPAVPYACDRCEHADMHASQEAATPTAATAQPGPGEVRVKIPIAGMHCDHCASRVQTALSGVDGVRWAGASLEKGEAIVVFDGSKAAATKLVKAIDALGFKAGKPVQD